MNKCKRYGIIGEPCHDFVIYLASIIQNLNRSVLVIDYTQNNSIVHSIINGDEFVGLIEYKNIDYIKGGYNAVNTLEYDVVFYVFSTGVSGESMKDSLENKELTEGYDEIFVITTMERNNIIKTAKFLLDIEYTSVHIIYRDMCESKIDQKYITMNFDLKSNDRIKNHFISLDIFDYEYRIRMEYEAYKEFKNLSEEYISFLKKIIRDLFDVSNKEINKAYSRAKRGQVF